MWISWFEAEAYARWRGARLPTEAEWEYAARGPESRLFPWGNRWDTDRANSNETGLQRTVAVTSYRTGLSWCAALNMSGNAWEWTADWYDPDYFRAGVRDNPIGALGGTERVLRGGSWGSPPSSNRATRRAKDVPSFRSMALGFRLANSAESANKARAN